MTKKCRFGTQSLPSFILTSLTSLVLLACGGSGGSSNEKASPKKKAAQVAAEAEIKKESLKYDTTAPAKKVDIPKFDFSIWNVLYKTANPPAEFHLAENINEFVNSNGVKKFIASKQKVEIVKGIKEKEIFYHKGETTPDLWGIIPYADFINHYDENVAPYFTPEEIAGVNQGIDQLAQRLIDQGIQPLNGALKPASRSLRTSSAKDTTSLSWHDMSSVSQKHEFAALLSKKSSSIGLKNTTSRFNEPLHMQGILNQKFGPLFSEIQLGTVKHKNETFAESVLNQISIGVDLPSGITPYVQVAHNSFAYNLTSISSNIGMATEIESAHNIFYLASLSGNAQVGHTHYSSPIQPSCISVSLQLITKIKTTNGATVYFEGELEGVGKTSFSIKMEYEI